MVEYLQEDLYIGQEKFNYWLSHLLSLKTTSSRKTNGALNYVPIKCESILLQHDDSKLIMKEKIRFP